MVSGAKDIDRRDALRVMGAAALVGAGITGGAVPGHGAGPKISTRSIPSSGEQLPVVGLGTYRTFDVGGARDDRRRLRAVLDELFSGGGKIIDSSPMYGRAEGVVGDLLDEMEGHAHAFLATKVWTEGREEGRAQMERSFRLFRAARIDLMQIHNLVDWRTQLKSLRAWKDAGRFRYIGITHYTTSAFDDVMSVMGREPMDFVQIPYSIALREAEARLLPLAAEKRIAVIANRPFEGGDLFGKVRGRALPPWVADFDCDSWARFFLKFILSHPAMTCVIPGTGRPEYMRDNMGAGRGRLPDGATRQKMAALIRTL